MVGASRIQGARGVFALLILLAASSFFSPRQSSSAQQAWSLPAPWSAQDIGSPAIAGSATFNQGTFTITAGGSDIGGRSDQFTFVYQQVSGDVDISARVDSVSAADNWSKTGVMIRSSLSANAANRFAFVSAARGVDFQRRSTDGSITNTTNGPSAVAPYWVRLVRKGTAVTAYSSADGRSWSAISSRSIALGATVYVGIATTSRTSSTPTTAVVSQVAVTPLSLPAPQQSADIGTPAITGSASYQQGVYTIHAGGADIGGTSDQFQFVYQPLAGDGEVIARVQSITNTNSGAKTGVMIRETLAADSRDAFVSLSAGAGYAFQRRIDPAGVALSTSGSAGTAPGWVRLVRTGSQFDAYQSTDGTNWTLIGSDAVPMVANVYVGIATTSHSTTTATDAVLDNFKLTQGTTANQPPIVSITSPTDGSIFTAGQNIVVTAAANDSDGTVSRVDFFAGSTPLGSIASAPYTVSWNAVPAGTYSLTAVAVDNDGASTTSSAISVRVDPAANQPPSVTLTAPANGATFTAPATVSLAASAADTDGTIARVEFYSGTTLLNSDTTAPYAFTWSAVAAGTYSITAVAYDNNGASATSSASSITVTAASGLPSPWTASDIGSPALSGSTTYANGVFSVDAGGNDIWGTADQFQFVYQPVSGDVEIVARVDSLTAVDPFSAAGVMVRGALTAGSVHGFSTLTGSNGVYVRRRLVTDGTTTSAQGAVVAAPYWVRLVRLGNVVTAYSSPDGITWTSTGSQTVPLGTTAYVGLAVCSDNVNVRTTAQFSNVRIGPPSANQAPTVSLTAPTTGSTFTAPATVTMTATAADSDGTIAKVEFYNGTTLLNTATTAPYSFAWSSVPAGTYTLKAIAYDNAGATASSATSTITVSQATSTPPTGIAFTASADHATLVTSYELRIYASGADPNTATPIATSDLGKPTPDANNDITVDRAAFFSALSPGNYVAAVAAIGAGGASVSSGVSFSR